MSIKATAVIKKESKVDPKKPRDKGYYAALQLFGGDGNEYGLPRYFSGFEEVGVLLKREAGVTHEQLQDCFPRYERGEEVPIALILEDDEAISRMGFGSRVA